MWQVVFAHISIESRVVNSDVNGLLDGSGDAMTLSSNDLKARTRRGKKETSQHIKEVTLWYHTPKYYVRATDPYVASMESRHTSKGGTHWRTYWCSKGQSNIIYWYRCGRTECDDEYVRELARTFEERFKEHLKAPSQIYEHGNTTGHKTTVENFNILGTEGHGISRTIKEAIYIRVNNSTLNGNVGKYNLPHIWDKVLFATPELKIKIKN